MDIKTLTVGPIATNCYIVDTGSNTNIVIDPGFGEEKIIARLKSDGKKTTHIIYTHSHWDHTGAGKALKQYSQAEVIMGENGLKIPDKSGESIASLMGVESSAAAPDRFLKDGDKINSGEVEFTVKETPGHSPGGILLFAEYAIFCGDTIFYNSIGRTDLPDGDYDSLLKSIKEKILTADENLKLYPGHGPATTVGREKEKNPYLN